MHFENKSHIEAFRHHSQIFISTVYCFISYQPFNILAEASLVLLSTRQSNLTFFLRHEHSQRRTKSMLSVGARAFVFHTQTVAAISGAACLSQHNAYHTVHAMKCLKPEQSFCGKRYTRICTKHCMLYQMTSHSRDNEHRKKTSVLMRIKVS